MQIKVGTKTLLTVSSSDLKCLDNDLVDKEDWFKKAIIGKINQCKKRLFREWIPKLREKNITIPASDDDLVTLIVSQPDYKNRAEKEAIS